jgi:hypothetical protein
MHQLLYRNVIVRSVYTYVTVHVGLCTTATAANGWDMTETAERFPKLESLHLDFEDNKAGQHFLRKSVKMQRGNVATDTSGQRELYRNAFEQICRIWAYTLCQAHHVVHAHGLKILEIPVHQSASYSKFQQPITWTMSTTCTVEAELWTSSQKLSTLSSFIR